jgi:DNA polymerase III delta prime subunit
MNNTVIDQYILSVSGESTTPSIMSEANILLFLTKITNHHITSYEDLIEFNITNVSIYDIPEDKKEFNIETVRKCIIDIELKPYTWKHVYILRHFDTANHHAQNALLKILEESPDYAIVILEISNPNSILDTIKSRTINLSNTSVNTGEYTIATEIANYYKNQKFWEIAKILYGLKCTSDEAIKILQSVYPMLSPEKMEECDASIESLSMTHENPRSILDVFFL